MLLCDRSSGEKLASYAVSRIFPHFFMFPHFLAGSLGWSNFIYKKAEKSCCEEVVADTMGLPPPAEGQQIIVVGQQKSGGGGGCAQCDQKEVVYR